MVRLPIGHFLAFSASIVACNRAAVACRCSAPCARIPTSRRSVYAGMPGGLGCSAASSRACTHVDSGGGGNTTSSSLFVCRIAFLLPCPCACWRHAGACPWPVLYLLHAVTTLLPGPSTIYWAPTRLLAHIVAEAIPWPVGGSWRRLPHLPTRRRLAS